MRVLQVAKFRSFWALTTILLSSNAVAASPVRFNLENVTFGTCLIVNGGTPCVSGGVASGYFVIEPSTGQLSEWDITVDGGDPLWFPSFEYTSTGGTAVIGVTPFSHDSFIRFSQGNRFLALVSVPDFWSSTAPVPLNVGLPGSGHDQSVENVAGLSGASRFLTLGSLEPALVGLKSLDVTPPEVVGGAGGQDAASALVTLTGPAPSGGVSVRLSADTVWPVSGYPVPTVASVDPEVTVQEQATTANAPITTVAVDFPVVVQVTASFNGIGK